MAFEPAAFSPGAVDVSQANVLHLTDKDGNSVSAVVTYQEDTLEIVRVDYANSKAVPVQITFKQGANELVVDLEPDEEGFQDLPPGWTLNWQTLLVGMRAT